MSRNQEPQLDRHTEMLQQAFDANPVPGSGPPVTCKDYQVFACELAAVAHQRRIALIRHAAVCDTCRSFAKQMLQQRVAEMQEVA